MPVLHRGMGALSSIHMAGLAQATCKPPRNATNPGSSHGHGSRCGLGNVPLRGGVGGCGAVGGCGSDLVLQALMWKAALCRTRGGSATQLRKHHPGQRLCLYSILNRNHKKGGGGEGGGGKSGAFLSVYLDQIHLSFHI